MAQPRRITDRRVRLLRQMAQLLHRPYESSVADVVRRLVGIPAQDRSAAPLALRARSPALVARDVEAALFEERSIVWTWAMRGTLHLIAAEDHSWLVPLTAEASLPGAYRRLTQEGVSGDQPAKALRLIERMLATEGPMTRAEIAHRLARRGIRTEGQAAAHLIRLAALHGLACHGPSRNGKPTVVLVRDWLEPARRLERDAALGELASRYLAAHAPAAPEDFGAWSGLRATDARQAWRAIAGGLVEFGTRLSSLWMFPSSDVDPPSGILRLVPAFDPYLLGWKGRGLSLPKEHARRVFPGGGLLRPAVVVDGLAAGTWGTQRAGNRLLVTVRPFARFSTAVQARVAAEAEDVGRFFDVPADLAIE